MSNLELDLRQLENTQLVRPFREEEQAYIFKHALTQDAAYRMLLVKQRREIHRRVAQTLETMYADCLDDHVALLARHYAEAGDDEKTSHYSIRAGEMAMRLYAFPEARFHFNNALDALAHLPNTPANRQSRLQVLIRLTNASIFADEPTQHMARLNEAEQIAQDLVTEEPAVRQQLAFVYYWQGFVRLMRNETRETFRYYRQAHALAQQIHADQLAAQLTFEFAIVLNLHGRFSEAEPLIIESIRLMQQAGKPLEDVIALAQWGTALAGRGKYTEGLRQALTSLARVQAINFVYGIEVNQVLLAWIYFLGGEPAQSLQAAQQAVELARQAGDWIQVFAGSVFAAWALSRLGQHAAAALAVAQIQTMVEKSNAQLVDIEIFYAARAEIALNANQMDDALGLAQQAVSAAQANEVIFAEGIAERVWAHALLARHASAEEIETHFARSLAAFERGDVKLEAARTHRAWGQFLYSCGKASAAREHLELATKQFELSGMSTELAEVEQVMREAKYAA